MTTLEQRLAALLAAQTEHPVYPRLTLRAVDEKTLDSVIDYGPRRYVLPIEEVVRRITDEKMFRAPDERLEIW